MYNDLSIIDFHLHAKIVVEHNLLLLSCIVYELASW